MVGLSRAATLVAAEEGYAMGQERIVRSLLGTEAVSRRTVLRRAGGGGLVAAVSLPLGAAFASAQGTPVGSPVTAGLPAPLPDWVAAWNALDAARIASYYTEDADYDNVSGAMVIHGRAAIQGFLSAYFAAFTGPSAHFTNVFASDDHATGEWEFSGKYTGQFPGLPAGTGQSLSFRGVSVLELSGGLIARDTEYVDYVAILRQLGLIQSPSGTPAPVASPAT